MPPHPRQTTPAPTTAPAGSAANTGSEAREVEWQLTAPDLGVVRRWLEQHPRLDRLSIAPLPAQQLHDTYLDTETGAFSAPDSLSGCVKRQVASRRL